MVLYSIIMAYTVFAAFYLTGKSIENALLTGTITLGNNVFTNLMVSSMSTIGLYFIMSILYLDPWHMLTSFLQYFLLLPTYVCTLQIFAFCNTHDVSWGTKGDNKVHTDLGEATGKGTTSDVVEVEVPNDQLDIDSTYEDALAALRERREVPSEPPSEHTIQEDYYREIRTRLVLVWIVLNGLLAMGVTEAFATGEGGTNGYLKFILWAVAALAVFRASGSAAFLAVNVVQRLADERVKLSQAASERFSGKSG